MNKLFAFLMLLIPLPVHSQAVEKFLADSVLANASYSIFVAEVSTGNPVIDINSTKSLTPASVLKLITSAVALELLGPDHTFTTQAGYTGKLSKSGKLDGDIVIKGGGDPALASPHFMQYYQDFPDRWINALNKEGIRKITGRILADDSYYDYLPVSPKWLWEDAGNYYGAGVYGISLFDNSYDIHLRTLSGNATPVITGVTPVECRYELKNYLVSAGSSDRGYVFAAPYSSSGWISGEVPVNLDDFVLSASIPDPPLLLSEIFNRRVKESGINIKGKPSTVRIQGGNPVMSYTPLAEYISPPLSEIIEVLNHESVNLYAESLVKELGKKFTGTGSAAAGLVILNSYLDSLGIKGMYIVDGSGLSPVNSINARGLSSLMIHMKNAGRYFEDYIRSFPDAGKEGTLKNWFRDEVFSDRLKAKSGSMTRVRSYAGYFTALSGKEMVFAFIANDFGGPSGNIARHFEQILKEIILSY